MSMRLLVATGPGGGHDKVELTASVEQGTNVRWRRANARGALAARLTGLVLGTARLLLDLGETGSRAAAGSSSR
ncbi:MAG TPA: hypothetical protein VLI71_07955 [Gammaproteobacteria bacterium]|nr:hypothetical protein [Gammaproteobacteria bacterium]